MLDFVSNKLNVSYLYSLISKIQTTNYNDLKKKRTIVINKKRNSYCRIPFFIPQLTTQ